jgi:SulP family sulfate permease
VLGAVSQLAPVGTGEFVELAALLAVLVGLWRLLLGLLRGGRLAYLMSQPVLLGFTAASGVLIVASQVPGLLGAPAGDGNPLPAAREALSDVGSWQLAATAFAAATVLVMVLGRRLSPLFPSVLLAVVASIGLSAAVGFDGPTVGDLPAGLPPLTLDLPWSEVAALAVPSLVIALIGFAEPSAIARRYAAEDRHRWDADRELTSQGLANLAAGIGGGYPVGGSFSRTALNRNAGARTRWSGAVSGLVTLAVLPLAGLLADLPTAVLAAVVVTAVVPLVDLAAMREVWRYSRPQAGVVVVTFAITLALAPRVDIAVLIGIVLAIAVHLWREVNVSVPSWTEGDELHLRPRGVVFFGSTPALEEALLKLLAAHRGARRLVLHLDGLGRLDLTGALALRAVLDDALAAGVEVRLADVPPHLRRIVSRVLPDLMPRADESRAQTRSTPPSAPRTSGEPDAAADDPRPDRRPGPEGRRAR